MKFPHQDYVQTEDGHIQQPTPNNNAIKASEFPRLKLSHFGASIKKKQKPVCRPRHLLLEGGGGNNRYGHGSGYDSDGVSPSSSIRRGNHSSNHNNPNKLFLDCGAFGSGRLHLRRHSMMDPSVVTSTGRRSERIEHDDDEGLRRHHYHNPINHHTSFYAPHPHMMAHSQHHQRLDKNRSSDAARTNNSGIYYILVLNK